MCGVPPSSSKRHLSDLLQVAPDRVLDLVQSGEDGLGLGPDPLLQTLELEEALVTDCVSPSWMWVAHFVRSCNSNESTVCATVGWTLRVARRVELVVATLVLSMGSGPVLWV